jgi:hypothetical protein
LVHATRRPRYKLMEELVLSKTRQNYASLSCGRLPAPKDR